MTYHDYDIYMSRRQRIICINKKRRLKGLPPVPVPERIKPPKLHHAALRLSKILQEVCL